MQLHITTDDGILIETLEDLEGYDLSQQAGRNMLVNEIRGAVERASDIPEEEQPIWIKDDKDVKDYKIIIRPATDFHPNSKWIVMRILPEGNDERRLYLHHNGRWFTAVQDTVTTGFFKTYGEALKTLEAYDPEAYKVYKCSI